MNFLILIFSISIKIKIVALAIAIINDVLFLTIIFFETRIEIIKNKKKYIRDYAQRDNKKTKKKTNNCSNRYYHDENYNYK